MSLLEKPTNENGHDFAESRGSPWASDLSGAAAVEPSRVAVNHGRWMILSQLPEKLARWERGQRMDDGDRRLSGSAAPACCAEPAGPATVSTLAPPDDFCFMQLSRGVRWGEESNARG